MTPQHAKDLLNALKRKPLNLDEAHDWVRPTGSSWSRDQLELFLCCAPGVHQEADGRFHVYAGNDQEDLQVALVEAVRSFTGAPPTARQVRLRMPDHFVTTDEQILALVRRTPGLETFGPNLIRPSR